MILLSEEILNNISTPRLYEKCMDPKCVLALIFANASQFANDSVLIWPVVKCINLSDFDGGLNYVPLLHVN